MDIKITKTDGAELVEIHCHDVSEEVREIIGFVRSRDGKLTGYDGQRQFSIAVGDICYIESVDNRVFICTEDKTCEAKEKLYELEDMLADKHFLRVSKSMLLNLMKISFVKPALNGRFTAVLMNGEQVMISRKYVPDLKKALKA